MKIYVQWAKATVWDYVEMDSADWAGLTRKAEPDAGRTPVFDVNGDVVNFTGSTETVDDTDGWLQRLFCMDQGFSGDHVSIVDISPGVVEVAVWDDDASEHDADMFEAQVWRMYQELVEWRVPSGDGFLSSKNGPRNDQTWYLGAARKADFEQRGKLPCHAGSGDYVTVLPWGDFVPPTAAIHGIWLEQNLNESLRGVASPLMTEWFP